jgi:class 3 adenylate cyclase
MTKTILELDLVGYSDRARMLEQNDGAAAVAALNAQIQTFVDEGLLAIKADRRAVVANTGDGAIVLLDNASHAHDFARAVHESTRKHNLARSEPSAKRWFRIGAATGDVQIAPQPDGSPRVAGTVIANAVRLEAAARPGELLIDTATHVAFPDMLKLEYGTEERVKGKREEEFSAHRRTFVADAPADAAPKPREKSDIKGKASRRQALALIDNLYPPENLEKLIFLLDMPLAHQPARVLTLAERRIQVLSWATAPGGPGLEETLEALQDLVKP